MSYTCEVSQQFYTEKLVRANRPHKCIECGGEIERGERYWRCVGMWDHQVSTCPQHVYCYHFARSINGRTDGPTWTKTKWLVPISSRPSFAFAGIDGGDDCIAFGGLNEFLHDICEDENAPAIRFWDAMISGCTERFEAGAGI